MKQSITIIIAIFISLVVLDGDVNINSNTPSSDSLIGSSVTVAGDMFFTCGRTSVTTYAIYYWKGDAPDKVQSMTYITDDEEIVLAATKNNETINLVISNPGKRIDIFEMKVDQLGLVNNITLKPSEGHTVVVDKNWLAYSGSDNNTTAYAIVVSLNGLHSYKVPVYDREVNCTLAFSLALRSVNDSLTLAIGNPSLNGFANGSVYIYHTLTTHIAWNLQRFEGFNESYFGYSLSFNSDATNLLIGVPGSLYSYKSYPNEIPHGHVYLFSNNDTNWELEYTFNGTDQVFYNFFGISVAFSSGTDKDTIVIASVTFQFQLRSFIFKRDGNDWTLFKSFQTFRTLIVDEDDWDTLGLSFLLHKNYTIAMNDNYVIAGLTFFSNWVNKEKIGTVFIASTIIKYLALNQIALIIAVVFVGIAFVFGIVQAIIIKRNQAQTAYQEIYD